MNIFTQTQWMHPSTWPPFFYIWLAFAAISFAKPTWDWLQRKRAANWPVVNGHIESVDIRRPWFSFKSKQGNFVVELKYSYFADGSPQTGRLKRKFSTEYAVQEFARDMEGKAVAVHCNPDKPSWSLLLPEDLDVVLQAKDPANAIRRPDTAITRWLERALPVCMFLAGVGLVVSLWVHVGAVRGRQVAPMYLFGLLHVGAILLSFPVILVARDKIDNWQRLNALSVLLADAPTWMRYVVYGFFGYAIINFALYMFGIEQSYATGNPSVAIWRGFSGRWMLFYSAAFAVFYSHIYKGRTQRE